MPVEIDPTPQALLDADGNFPELCDRQDSNAIHINMVAVFITGGNNVTGVKGRYREDWETVLPINRQTSVDMRKKPAYPIRLGAR